MPVISEDAMREVLERSVEEVTQLQENALELVKRVHIPINSTTPPQLIAAIRQDPWSQAGKYALGWVYFCIILLVITTFVRLWNYWGDRIRIALYKDEIIASARLTATPMTGSAWDQPASTQTDNSRQVFFPPAGPLLPRRAKQQSTASAIAPFNNLIALFRYVFYRPIPVIRIGSWVIVTPSLPVVVIIFAGVAFSLLYCFLPQPLFYASMGYGSPPLAIRAGMMSIALVPWIAALASKANIISLLTGIDHERLIVLHRWGAYICFMLAIIHAVPYWWQSVHDPAGFEKFKLYFSQHYYIFTTGISALAPLIFLIVHSLPIIRNRFYEFFVILHIPVAWAFIGLLFWHCNNYLTSWAYLYTTVILMVVSLIARLFFLNWMNPMRPSWLIGEESAVTILPENAVKVTIPTQVRWKPGQYAYLRMPGISVVENHPFTIASLCSEDFPSDYGDNYRNMSLVFRPFSGFTRKVHDMAVKKGPYKTYRSFIEGPYGGMQRQMASFDQVVFFAGGSGITAIASQLLDLVKRMRDGKATTRSVHVIWAMKRPEIMEWFKEELRICREYAPAGSVHCHFFITATQRSDQHAFSSGYTKEGHRFSQLLVEKVDGAMAAVGKRRDSKAMEQLDNESEDYDSFTALPQRKAFASPITAMPGYTEPSQPYFPPPPGHPDAQEKPDKQKRRVSNTLTEMPSDAEEMSRADALYNQHRSFAQRMASVQTNDFAIPAESHADEQQEKRLSSFNFGFPAEPTQYQKSLMRFAYLPEMPLPSHQASMLTEDDEIKPAPFPLNDIPNMPTFTAQRMDGWRTEYGRPDIPYMLKNLSQQFSRRACIYVCGPPSMRTDVARTVAALQSEVWKHPERDEIFLHAENYAI